MTAVGGVAEFAEAGVAGGDVAGGDDHVGGGDDPGQEATIVRHPQHRSPWLAQDPLHERADHEPERQAGLDVVRDQPGILRRHAEVQPVQAERLIDLGP